MAPSRRWKKGPVLPAEFPKDTYAILPDELSQVNEVNFDSISLRSFGNTLGECRGRCTCDELLHS